MAPVTICPGIFQANDNKGDIRRQTKKICLTRFMKLKWAKSLWVMEAIKLGEKEKKLI
jgi:hypothetical protein